MPVEAITETDQTFGLIPSAPWRLNALTVLPGQWLAVTFQDGTQGVADLSSELTAPECGIFSALKNEAFFAQPHLELGLVTWPNGADLDPVWMDDELGKSKTWSVPIWPLFRDPRRIVIRVRSIISRVETIPLRAVELKG